MVLLALGLASYWKVLFWVLLPKSFFGTTMEKNIGFAFIMMILSLRLHGPIIMSKAMLLLLFCATRFHWEPTFNDCLLTAEEG